jgi:hypothetical protein
MRGQIKENESIIKELEMSWEDKLKQSTDQLSQAVEQTELLKAQLADSAKAQERIEFEMNERY